LARKQMNILDLEAWLSSTFQGRVKGRHVANVYYDKGSGTLMVKLRGGDLLVAEPGRRIHLSTRAEPPKEFKPDPLVVLARKHVRGARVEDARLVGGDRIVELVFSRGYRLVVELVPRGVAALVDPQGTLLAASKYLRVRDRELRPKKPYVPPPARPSKLTPSPEEVLEALKPGGKLVPLLVRGLGVPAEAAEEALYRAGLGREAESVGPEDAERVAAALAEIVAEARGGRGFLARVEGAPVEASPFKPTHYEAEGGDVEERASLDEALDELFASGGGQRARPREGVEAERERLLASLRRAQEIARGYEEEAERLRRAADYVARNYELFARLANCASRSRAPGEIESCSGVPVVSADERGLTVEVEGLRIGRLCPRRSWSRTSSRRPASTSRRRGGRGA